MGWEQNFRLRGGSGCSGEGAVLGGKGRTAPDSRKRGERHFNVGAAAGRRPASPLCGNWRNNRASAQRGLKRTREISMRICMVLQTAENAQPTG